MKRVLQSLDIVLKLTYIEFSFSISDFTFALVPSSLIAACSVLAAINGLGQPGIEGIANQLSDMINIPLVSFTKTYIARFQYFSSDIPRKYVRHYLLYYMY